MKSFLAFILFVLMVLGCVACQPTPDKPNVQSKASGELERKIASDPVEAAYGKLPENIHEMIHGKLDEVTIFVDADIEAPPVVKIPVCEYELYEYTPDDLRVYTEYFMQGKDVYKVPTKLTKSQLRPYIVKMEEQLSDKFLDEYYGNDESTKNEMREIWGTEYKLLKQYYDEAPETIEHEPVEYEYISQIDYMDQATYADNYAFALYNAKHGIDGAQEELDKLTKASSSDVTQVSFRGLADLDGGYTGCVSAGRFDSKKKTATGFSFSRSKIIRNNMPTEIFDIEYVGTPVTISEDEARKYVEDALQGLGIYDEYELESYSMESPEMNDASFHFFRYRRKLADGICAIDYFFNLAAQTDEQYVETRPTLGCEEITAYVDDDGIALFRIENPLKCTQTVNSSVELMKFEDVYDIFKQYAALHYDNIESITEYEDGTTYTQYADEVDVNIKEIYLAGIRIVRKNDISRYLIVPVWIFKGFKKTTFTSFGDVNTGHFGTSVIINAIDGTIINPNDCY